MRLRTQLFIIFSLIIILTVGTIGFLFYREIGAVQFDRLRDTLTAYAVSASMLIDGDRHPSLAEPGGGDDPYLDELRDLLRRFARIDPRIAEVYTMVRTERPRLLRFIVDAAEARDKDGDGVIGEDELPARFGEEYDIAALPQMRRAFEGPEADDGLTRDRWGWWLSAYAPVRDAAGRAVAIVGIDVAADTIRAQQAQLFRTIALICAVFLAFGLVAASAYAYRLTGPLNDMVRAAREIGRGNYEHRVETASQNEIGFLAGTMNAMAENIRRSFDKLSTLNRTANILASTLDLEQALKISLNLAIEVTRSSRGVILMADRLEDRIEIIISEGAGETGCGGEELRIGGRSAPALLRGDRKAQIREWLEMAGCTQCFTLVTKDAVRGYVLLNPEIRDEEFLNTLMKQISFAVDNARLFHDAITDGLTGLFLKRYFHIQLDIELRRSQRHGRPLALLLLDVDHFKSINDTWGHPVGDTALREIAGAIRGCIRSTDIAARFGGEEFAVILPETTAEGALRIAERLRAGIAARRLAHGGAEIAVTASAGVRAVAGGTVPPSAEVIRTADEALYRAKRDGRNRVVLWEGA
ncbi:MAG: diguanylate cyclase [bacterium]|nr:diguanylate cyclase [bacterium]